MASLCQDWHVVIVLLTFNFSAAVVGFNFALTSGSVHANLLNSNSSLSSVSQYVQGVSQAKCYQLQYSVLSDKQQDTLILSTSGKGVTQTSNDIEADLRALRLNFLTDSVEDYFNNHRYYPNGTFASNLTDGVFRMAGYVPRALQDTAIFVSVSLLDCPPGFALSNKPHKCDCNSNILEHNLTCNINDQTVHREGTTWVNSSFSRKNLINGVLIHQHCPFGYCKQEPVDVDLPNPDTQCAYDHSGTLCGACRPNLSLALGSSQCLANCSNTGLLLLIPFSLAGLALVFFIKILNLTVSQGTINGLIFYANVIAANTSIFFPAQFNKVLWFLSVFISWVNLDFGIETCFIKGLDAYWKTWLQFVFPCYVWAVAGAIIVVSHNSARFTRLFGTNSLSVLATLYLLSYARLFQSIITIFSFTILVHPDGSTSRVWAFDGNIQYLSPKHILLFVFAACIVLLMWLPYTAVLLFAQWLRTQTHRRGLFWLSPWLDA